MWIRGHEGKDLTGQIAHHEHGLQYVFVAYSEWLDTAGIKPSTRAVGSSYDNGPAECVIGLYKTELVKSARPRKGLDDLEIATSEWVGSTTAGPSSTAKTSRQSMQRPLTTKPQQPSESETEKSPDTPGRFTKR